MSIGGKIRVLGYYLKDLFKFKKDDRIFTHWKDIEKTLSNYETGWVKVENSLKNCLEYATGNCEFYKEYKGKELKDFPILTKMDFIKNFDKIKTPIFKDEELHTSSTSGSTGIPFKVVQDRTKRNRVLAELQYFGEIAGYPSHEKMVFYRSNHQMPFWSSFWSNVWQPDSSVFSKKNLLLLHKYQKNATAILGYGITLGEMIDSWMKNGLQGSNSVKVVLTGAEMMTKKTRELSRNFWKNSNISSRYSNMENGIFAQEMLNCENQYKINWASYYFEVLKLDSDEPAEDGELGRLVVTDMYNKAFPMIRYENGDIVKMSKVENDFPIFTDVQGRRLDLIYNTSGVVLSSHAIGNRMWGIKGGIKQWQFVQESKTEYKIIYTADNKESAEQGILAKEEELKETLGKDATIKLEYTNEIPVLNSGKRKMMVQNCKFYKGGG